MFLKQLGCNNSQWLKNKTSPSPFGFPIGQLHWGFVAFNLFTLLIKHFYKRNQYCSVCHVTFSNNLDEIPVYCPECELFFHKSCQEKHMMQLDENKFQFRPVKVLWTLNHSQDKLNACPPGVCIKRHLTTRVRAIDP